LSLSDTRVRGSDQDLVTVADIFNKIPPHALVRGWLGRETVERLLWFAQSNEERFEDTQVTRAEDSRIDHTRRVSKKLSLGNLKAEVRAKVADLLPVMFERLGIKPFIPSKIEVELVAHGDGAFFLRHIDTLTHREGRRRIISAVYYFHALPKAFSGGVLRLHSLAASGQQCTFVDITPDYDTLVFFPSFFPHEVLPVKCANRRFLDSRFAINFWIHRN
jgi:Rps23 Pro-64 3,4-dihydroxylase Tpa1-like proline 4-hydroxylase